MGARVRLAHIHRAHLTEGSGEAGGADTASTVWELATDPAPLTGVGATGGQGSLAELTRVTLQPENIVSHKLTYKGSIAWMMHD